MSQELLTEFDLSKGAGRARLLAGPYSGQARLLVGWRRLGRRLFLGLGGFSAGGRGFEQS